MPFAGKALTQRRREWMPPVQCQNNREPSLGGLERGAPWAALTPTGGEDRFRGWIAMTPVVFWGSRLPASMPTMDQRAGMPPTSRRSVYQGCLHDEQAAQAELQQNWTAYPAPRARIARKLGGSSAATSKCWVCIEIKTGNAAAGQQIATAAGPPPRHNRSPGLRALSRQPEAQKGEGGFPRNGLECRPINLTIRSIHSLQGATPCCRFYPP